MAHALQTTAEEAAALSALTKKTFPAASNVQESTTAARPTQSEVKAMRQAAIRNIIGNGTPPGYRAVTALLAQKGFSASSVTIRNDYRIQSEQTRSRRSREDQKTGRLGCLCAHEFEEWRYGTSGW